MTEQPEALWLADVHTCAFDNDCGDCIPCRTARELRRLHEAHDWQYKIAGERLRRIERDEVLLREALEALEDECSGYGYNLISALQERLATKAMGGKE